MVLNWGRLVFFSILLVPGLAITSAWATGDFSAGADLSTAIALDHGGTTNWRPDLPGHFRTVVGTQLNPVCETYGVDAGYSRPDVQQAFERAVTGAILAVNRGC